MSMSRRRVRAIVRKEFREYRRNGNIIATMAAIPLIFAIAPLVYMSTAAVSALRHENLLLYMLGIPAIVPAIVAAYSVVGERDQGTLEPVLTTPIRREEFLLAKELAVLVPSLAISCLWYGIVIACVALFGPPAGLSDAVRPPELLGLLLFTPLVAGWSIWIGIAISARMTDVRAAAQVSGLASLPTLAIAALIAFNAVHASLALAIGLAAALLTLDGLGWRIMLAMFDRERLITGTR